MDEIISQYGKAIITFVVVIALIALFVVLLNSNSGPVHDAFSELISNFLNKANITAGI